MKKLSQADFSDIFNVSRASVGAYEEGRSEPKIDMIIQIASYFGVSVDVLLTKDLTVNDLMGFDILNEKLDKAHELIKKGQKVVREKSFGFVRLDDYLEYLVNYKNKDFVSHLPSIQVPVAFPGVVRAFEMKGSEMEYHQHGLHHGDVLITRKVEEANLKVGHIFIVVTKEGIMTRRLKGREAGKNVKLSTDDPNYDEISVPLKDIYEMWEVKGVFSTYLNPPTFLAERILLLEKRMEQLAYQMKS